MPINGPSRRGRPRGSVNYKTVLRIEQAVFLESKGFSDADIAKHIGLTTGGLATLKRNPLYASVRIRTATGTIGELQQGLADNADYLRDRLKAMLPKALDNIQEAINSPDPKRKDTMSLEVLDRDGHLAKVSRIGLPTESQGGSGVNFETADAMLAALNVGKGSSSTTGT